MGLFGLQLDDHRHKEQPSTVTKMNAAEIRDRKNNHGSRVTLILPATTTTTTTTVPAVQAGRGLGTPQRLLSVDRIPLFFFPQF